MPRYFIDTYDHIAAIDEEGVEVLNRTALRTMVHETLAAMMKDERVSEPHAHLRADVRDENGDQVMTATLMLAISDHEESSRPGKQLNRSVVDGVEDELSGES